MQIPCHRLSPVITGNLLSSGGRGVVAGASSGQYPSISWSDTLEAASTTQAGTSQRRAVGIECQALPTGCIQLCALTPRSRCHRRHPPWRRGLLAGLRLAPPLLDPQQDEHRADEDLDNPEVVDGAPSDDELPRASTISSAPRRPTIEPTRNGRLLNFAALEKRIKTTAIIGKGLAWSRRRRRRDQVARTAADG